MNPLECKTKSLNDYFMDWKKMNPQPYNKLNVPAYTKVRQILMNGTEFEAQWFLHQFARHCNDNDIRRQIAIVRCQEQQQQKRISALKPVDENILETTIAYEQLAIDLTAILAKMESNQNNKSALDFALLEDFDHLYRFANLLKMDYDIDAKKMVESYTEIMPARPTISERRYPIDNIKQFMINKDNCLMSALVTNIITAAEQQTMNYYMNVATFYPNEYGRKMFSEIALVEEEHVSQYESLKDPNCTWLEAWVMHEYTECYLYHSMMKDETVPHIKKIYEEHYEMEVAHLKTAINCLKIYENKTFDMVIPNPEFPELIKFGSNIEYIRKVISASVCFTGNEESYICVNELPDDANFFTFQSGINTNVDCVASHDVIVRTIEKLGEDYRFETKPNPIKDLQNRKCDNTKLGRVKQPLDK